MVAALIQNGGWGSEAAAPIAHAVLDTYYKKKTGQFDGKLSTIARSRTRDRFRLNPNRLLAGLRLAAACGRRALVAYQPDRDLQRHDGSGQPRHYLRASAGVGRRRYRLSCLSSPRSTITLFPNISPGCISCRVGAFCLHAGSRSPSFGIQELGRVRIAVGFSLRNSSRWLLWSRWRGIFRNCASAGT